MEIFVFGSNLAGRHGAGAALEAKKRWGAIYGRGEGLQGQSYALPTKDATPWPDRPKTLSLEIIREKIVDFLEFAQLRSDLTFRMTRIGCGAGRLQGPPDRSDVPGRATEHHLSNGMAALPRPTQSSLRRSSACLLHNQLSPSSEPGTLTTSRNGRLAFFPTS